MISKLVIEGVEIPVTNEIPVATSYSVNDIREPDKRGGTQTKTIKLPGSQVVNKIFENIYQTNISLNTFNPNVAIEAIYYINEREQIKGDLQLKKIITKPDGFVEYECMIIGREGELFVAIGDKLMNQIDFSDFDHTFNKTEQKNSWATSYRKSGIATAFNYGDGYVYPFIKYGYNASDSQFDVNHFKPAVFAREWMKRIFTDAGKTWTSAFLDGNFFKHLIIPCNVDSIQLASSTIYNSQYFIGKTTATFTGAGSGTSAAVSAKINYSNVFFNPQYNLETGSYFDPSNQYDSVTTYQGTIATSGFYNVVAFAQIDLTVNATSLVGGKYEIQPNSSLKINIQTNAGSGWYNIAVITNTIGSLPYVNLGTATSFNCSAQTGSIWFGAGAPIRVLFSIDFIGTLRDSLNNPSPLTAYTIDYSIPNGSKKNEHYLLLADTVLKDGFTFTFNNSLPPDIKQRDFVKWIFNMFFLQVEQDKTNPNNYIIEPFYTFYSGAPENWTAKIDHTQNWEQSPMGNLNALNFVWSYKDDKDYYNDLYKKQYLENYGAKRHQVANDFIKNEQKTEIGFSPTPLVSNNSNSIICPHIYQKDGTTLKPLTHNLRILYYGGLKSSGNAWTYTSAPSGNTTETQYPYCGHLDDPLAPTVDLNFWYPKTTFYVYPLAYMTTNNLFNAYYSRWMNEITDKNSRIITCFVNLNELDIQKFSFRKRIFIDHPIYGQSYYIVNKIYDWNPLSPKPTKVELLKLKQYDDFVTDAIPIDPGYDPVSTSRIAYNPLITASGNTETTNTISIGTNNRIFGVGNQATGSDACYVDETSTGVVLINCARVSVVGVTNFVGIGLTDRDIDSTYNGKVLNVGEMNIDSMVGVDPASPTIFNVDDSVDVYKVDCTNGDVTALYDISTNNKKTTTFVRVDSSAYVFRIDEISGLPTVFGNAVPFDTQLAKDETINVWHDGSNFYGK